MNDFQSPEAPSAPRPELQNLMTTPLTAADHLEVVMSRVRVPIGVDLPFHFHTGEEFAYVMEGALTLVMKDGEDIVYSAGEPVVVRARVVHTIRAEADTTLIVFRVHEKGEPVRVVVKPNGEEIPLDR